VVARESEHGERGGQAEPDSGRHGGEAGAIKAGASRR
jgi:hypothetical protein